MVQSQPQQVLSQLHALLDSVPLDAYSGLAGVELAEVATSLMRLGARVKAHELAATRAVETSGEARRQGATSTGSLLAGSFGGDRRSADRAVKQAEAIAAASQTNQALAQGEVSVGQADLIVRTLRNLPESVTASQREACETQLLCDAPRMDLKQLARRADRISEVFAPDEVDAVENGIVADREKAAWARTEFWMVDQRDGTAKFGGVIPEAQADMLRNALEAISAPQIKNNDDDVLLDSRPTYAQRLGWAFCSLVEAIPADKLPDTAGVGAILTVNLDHEVLVDKVACATLSTGTKISAGQARRMACSLRILPAVFGGESLPLDVGRAKRLFTGHQRRALEFRDRGCIFPGCDRPPSWCVAHHARERWADGSDTNLEDGVLLCPHHHRVLHDDGWDIRFAPDGMPELVPPRTLDPARTPRRHARFTTTLAS
ncbi:HNH endonuclease signature motif containing protein [Aeromicrobium terrae]|nr:HNH endonuclease signature motif containing protein [Aeromicrobium terrae]